MRYDWAVMENHHKRFWQFNSSRTYNPFDWSLISNPSRGRRGISILVAFGVGQAFNINRFSSCDFVLAASIESIFSTFRLSDLERSSLISFRYSFILVLVRSWLFLSISAISTFTAAICFVTSSRLPAWFRACLAPSCTTPPTPLLHHEHLLTCSWSWSWS